MERAGVGSTHDAVRLLEKEKPTMKIRERYSNLCVAGTVAIAAGVVFVMAGVFLAWIGWARPDYEDLFLLGLLCGGVSAGAALLLN